MRKLGSTERRGESRFKQQQQLRALTSGRVQGLVQTAVTGSSSKLTLLRARPATLGEYLGLYLGASGCGSLFTGQSFPQPST